MSVGARVVRGPDWAGKQKDGGEGGLGTVVKEDVTNGKVKVIWDKGHEGHYRAGYDGRYELRIYDNAPTGCVHDNVTCDVCKMNPIEGMRWKCSTCDDFDLCTLCYMSGKHDLSHSFLLHQTQSSTLVPIDSRKRLKPETLHGILPGATVKRGLHWKWSDQDGGSKGTGEVIRLVKWGRNSYRGGVEVKWQNGSMNTYRCGGQGCMDLIVTDGKKDMHYFPQHLPVLDVRSQSECQLKPGDKVRVDIDAKIVKKILSETDGMWNEKISDYLPRLGTVTEIENSRTVEVQYEDAQSWYFYISMLTKIHSFSVGETVQILENINDVQKLQEGHGGWNDEMEEALGECGIIEAFDDDGDLIVKVGEEQWVFSPVCCRYVESADENESNSADENESSSADENESNSADENESNSADENESNSADENESNSSDNQLSDDIGDNISEMFCKLMLQGDKKSLTECLMEAAAQEDIKTVEEILSSDPSLVNETVDGNSPLQMASYTGSSEAVEILLKYKADLNLVDEEQNTALHFAVSQGEDKIVKMLVDKGAQVNIQNIIGLTPCHQAVIADNEEIVEILIDKGCDVNTQDEDGDTPLHNAMDNDQIFEMLMKVKEIRCDIFNHKGMSAFHVAVMNKKEKLAKLIVENQPSVVCLKTKNGGYTALHIAVINGYSSFISCLLSKGKADVNAKDNSHQTPLHLAVIRKSLPVVDVLLFASADLNAQDINGNTPSHLVYIKHSLDLLDSVILDGNEITEEDDISPDIIYMLADNGADLEIKNKDGKTPIDLIQNKDIARILRRTAQNFKTKPKNTTDPPSYWKSMEQGVKVQKIPLSDDDPLTREEYRKVYTDFKRTLPNRSVVAIHRIQNLDRWKHFALKKEIMKDHYGLDGSNEQQLFHGTKADIVDRIVNQGIDFRVVKRALYGDGAYFASESKTSDGYTEPNKQEKRFMFRVRVLVGKYTKGEKGMKKPPPVDESKPDELYDSVVNNTDRPTIFVIFDNVQCYAEYLIEYH